MFLSNWGIFNRNRKLCPCYFLLSSCPKCLTVICTTPIFPFSLHVKKRVSSPPHWFCSLAKLASNWLGDDLEATRSFFILKCILDRKSEGWGVAAKYEGSNSLPDVIRIVLNLHHVVQFGDHIRLLDTRWAPIQGPRERPHPIPPYPTLFYPTFSLSLPLPFLKPLATQHGDIQVDTNHIINDSKHQQQINQSCILNKKQTLTI